jgi:hypothetical protein
MKWSQPEYSLIKIVPLPQIAVMPIRRRMSIIPGGRRHTMAFNL